MRLRCIPLKFKIVPCNKKISTAAAALKIQTVYRGYLARRLCAICMCNLSSDKYITIMCHHKYHTKCIHKWCNKHKSCPLCRGKINVIQPNETFIEKIYITPLCYKISRQYNNTNSMMIQVIH